MGIQGQLNYPEIYEAAKKVVKAKPVTNTVKYPELYFAYL